MSKRIFNRDNNKLLLIANTICALIITETSMQLSIGSSLITMQKSTAPLIAISFTGLWISCLMITKFSSPLNSSRWHFPILFATFNLVICLAIVAYARWYYSRSFLMYFFCFSIVFMFFLQLLMQRINRWQIAIIDDGNTYNLTCITQGIKWYLVSEPRDLQNKKIDAIVGDLHHEQLKDEWVRTIADAALKNIPIYHTAALYESLLGKVLIASSAKLQLEKLKPSRTAITIKRILDLLAVILCAPLVILIVLITTVLIRLESPGKAIFTQKRIGKNGKYFTLYKLRSMHHNAETKGSQFAQKQDARVTKIGKIIRKMRIDELPQFFNVLIGDMSLIGPRPEQIKFAKQFEKDIPFYAYRHIVKPGITGWAQITQGYAANSEETKEKLAYDLYYIKRYSLMLDLQITLKTITTILSGFGAR